MAAAARIVGVGATALSRAPAQGQQCPSAVALMVQALQAAVADTRGLLRLQDIDTLIALPSLMSEHSFMMGHAVAQQAQLTPRPGMLVRTIDAGGAGPVAALLAAQRAIEHEGRQAVAIVGGDTVASAPLAEFLARADATCAPSSSAAAASQSGNEQQQQQQRQQQRQQQPGEAVPSPVIPNLYDRVARWHMAQHGAPTREQLAMCASLMTHQASRHPGALHRRPRLLQEVLASAHVAPVTTKLECAKLADGAAALVLVPASRVADAQRAVAVVGGGEASGPLSPPEQLSEACFSAREAAAAAYAQAGLQPSDISYWGIYDCFPICLIRGIEAVGLAPQGQGGTYIQQQYQALLASASDSQQQQQQHARSPDNSANTQHQRRVWPVNTHGGLLGAGAPWEAPAMYSLVEAVTQLRGEADGRQVCDAHSALVYANGGIFSASAVAILQRCSQHGGGAATADVDSRSRL